MHIPSDRHHVTCYHWGVPLIVFNFLVSHYDLLTLLRSLHCFLSKAYRVCHFQNMKMIFAFSLCSYCWKEINNTLQRCIIYLLDGYMETKEHTGAGDFSQSWEEMEMRKGTQSSLPPFSTPTASTNCNKAFIQVSGDFYLLDLFRMWKIKPTKAKAFSSSRQLFYSELLS